MFLVTSKVFHGAVFLGFLDSGGIVESRVIAAVVGQPFCIAG